MKCPICQKNVTERASNPSFPFCSPRCKTVDLGKWLGEEYRVASKFDEEESSVSQEELPPREDA